MAMEVLVSHGEALRCWTPCILFGLVLLLQLLSVAIAKRIKMEAREAQLRKEIKAAHREANALTGPSTFSQAAKLKRAAAKKEKELAQLTTLAKQNKGSSSQLLVFVLKGVVYSFVTWLFWHKPVASVPSYLLQPFVRFLSWPWKSNLSMDYIQVGILPWLMLCTRVSYYISNGLFVRNPQGKKNLK